MERQIFRDTTGIQEVTKHGPISNKYIVIISSDICGREAKFSLVDDGISTTIKVIGDVAKMYTKKDDEKMLTFKMLALLENQWEQTAKDGGWKYMYGFELE